MGGEGEGEGEQYYIIHVHVHSCMLCAVINEIHFSVYSLMSLWSHLTPALKVGTCRGGGG